MKLRQRGALACLLASLAAPAQGAGVMSASLESTAADPDAAAVTEANLLASERFWPYRVSLTEPLLDGEHVRLPAGMTGVLIRVESSGLPRIDFGRGGKLEVPVGRTDLLARANQIRTGVAAKAEPNFVHAIKTRMLDSASDTPRRLPPQAAEDRHAFLCVFADPAAAGFDELARALAPLRERGDVLTILFPQGRHPDASVHGRLRSLDWTVPFLFDGLSEPYTRTLVPDGTPMPWVMYQTSEGRVLLQGAWTPELASELQAAVRP
jgi:hypothetical protein